MARTRSLVPTAPGDLPVGSVPSTPPPDPDGVPSDDLGRRIRAARRSRRLSRSHVARSAGLTRRELAAYERGTPVPPTDLWCIAATCGVDVGDLLLQRVPLHVDADTLSIGDTVRRLREGSTADEVLTEYAELVRDLRDLGPDDPAEVREDDLTALATSLRSTPAEVAARLGPILGAPAGAGDAGGRPTTGAWVAAGPAWHVGGGPAVAVADDGTLALRPHAWRFALADVAVPGDRSVRTTLEPGRSVAGVLVHATASGSSLSGYAVTVGSDAVALAVWNHGSERPVTLARTPLVRGAAATPTDARTVEVDAVADRIVVRVDGTEVARWEAVSRSTLDAGLVPCRGDRAGVLAPVDAALTVRGFAVAPR